MCRRRVCFRHRVVFTCDCRWRHLKTKLATAKLISNPDVAPFLHAFCSDVEPYYVPQTGTALNAGTDAAVLNAGTDTAVLNAGADSVQRCQDRHLRCCHCCRCHCCGCCCWCWCCAVAFCLSHFHLHWAAPCRSQCPHPQHLRQILSDSMPRGGVGSCTNWCFKNTHSSSAPHAEVGSS